ncbi:MAG: hypothetical protein ACRD1Q_10060 [Vicinamibacterales bacterium]
MDLNGHASTTGEGLKRSRARTFVAIVISLVLLVSGGLWIGSMVPQLMAPTISHDQLEAASKVIMAAQQEGVLVRYNCAENLAHVQPVPWRALNGEMKRNLAAALATTCQAERRGNRVMLVDFRTGRRLANFSSGSFTVY